ncbi:MAG: tetratricopeptide repeat protein [Nitrospiraceae bacterium]|nr:tetratricopeptide repeat protein [Nitrospiraceae bacterium]
MPRISSRLLLAVFAALASVWLSSCAVSRLLRTSQPHAGPTQTRPAPAGQASLPQAGLAAAAAAKEKAKTFHAGRVVREAQADILKGRFELAIRVYRDAMSLHPGDRRLIAGYESALPEARKAADVACGKKDFARAGVLYGLLAEDYAGSSADGMSLMRQVRICARALTEQGLALYRQGRLKEAIDCWRGVLRFDPADTEVRKAMETAKLQIKNLSK